MRSQALKIDADNTLEREDRDTYIDTLETRGQKQRSAEPEAIEPIYVQVPSRKLPVEEIVERQVGWWLGRVEEVNESYFSAVLEDLQGRISVAEFDKEELSLLDLDLLAQGARFSYSVTRVDKRSGREYVSKLALSGPPIWREKDDEKAKEYAKHIFPEDLLDV